MSNINTLRSKHYRKKLNASHRMDQYPPDMVLLELNTGNFEDIDLAFQWASRRLIGINTIPLDYVPMYNEVSNYEAYWFSIKERLKNCVTFTGKAKYRRKKTVGSAS